MDEEKKTSKVVRYKLQKYFLKQHFGQNFQIMYPPGTASCCFLSYILSTVPMAIAPYSEREAGVCVCGGGSSAFLSGLFCCCVKFIACISSEFWQTKLVLNSLIFRELCWNAWRHLIAFGGRHLNSLQWSGILCFPIFLAVSNQDPRSRDGKELHAAHWSKLLVVFALMLCLYLSLSVCMHMC